MARIYIARSTGIGSFERHVVLKMILPERAHDETSVQMFLDEARLAASLNHQNVAQVFEVGKEAGIHFLAMEYVHGQDLRALLARAGSSGTRLPLELALTVVVGAAAGLDHAHERRTSDGTPMGIVHRDVSPSNIMIGYDGAVKLLDFGIAKATSRSIETQSGVIKGKFAYMAPEQCRGREVDRRSDVFSLGIILYEVTTQHRCFRADSDFDTMHRIVTGDVVRPTRLVQGYPQALEAIVMKALAIDPAQRYQTSALLLEAVEGFAAAARMPLSTTSLGRFMRDMFGDVLEPWLVTGEASSSVPAKEQTISSTNSSGEQPRARPPSPPPVQRPPTPPVSFAAVPPPSSHSSPSVQRPPAPPASFAAVPPPSSHSSPSVQRPPAPSASFAAVPPSSSHSSPSLQRPPAPSASFAAVPSPPSHSAPSLQRPPAPSSSLAVPPQHEEAPLYLPPDLPLDLPVGEVAAAGPAPAGWSARGYPAMSPADALAPEARLVPPNLPAMPAPLPSASNEGSALVMPAAPGAQLPPPHATERSTSEAGAAHGAAPLGMQPIVGVRQGHAGAPALSPSEVYPRFDAQELDGNISLQPGNRLLYIAIGAVLVGIIAVLVILIAEDPEELPAPPRPTPSLGSPSSSAPPRPDPVHDVVAARRGGSSLEPQPVKPEALQAVAARKAAGSNAQPSPRAAVHLHVVSTPPGAEVSLGGKPIGTTPLATDLDSRGGTGVLTIHRARYQDVTAAIDLDRDYERTVTLAPIAEPAPARPPAPGRNVRTAVRERATVRDDKRPAPAGSSAAKEPREPREPKEEACQPPDKLNPFENACHGHVCKPCPAPTP